AFDFLELIAVDRNIAARARRARPARKRPERGQNGRGRHQCESEPQRHKSIHRAELNITDVTRRNQECRGWGTPSAVTSRRAAPLQRRTTVKAATWGSGTS